MSAWPFPACPGWHPLGCWTWMWPDTVQEVHRIFDERFRDLCQGQFLDLAFQGRLPTLEEYLTMVRLKTGVLLGVACEVGAVVAQAGLNWNLPS